MNGITCRCCTAQNLGRRHPHRVHLLNKCTIDPVVVKRFLQEYKHRDFETYLGNSAFVLNAQEMGSVIPGRLRSLMCCSIASQRILCSRIGSVKDFTSITLEE